MKNFNQHITQMAQHINLPVELINNLFLDSADEFLKDYAGSQNAANVWKATPEFWGWWQQIWYGRDKMILKRYPRPIKTPLRQKLYEIWHNPKYMQIKPNSVVYDGFVRTMKKQQILLNQIA